MIFAAMMIASLAACGNNGHDKLAERVEDGAENRGDAMDAIDAADANARAISQERRDVIIVNEAAAVRRFRCPPMPHIDGRFGP